MSTESRRFWIILAVAGASTLTAACGARFPLFEKAAPWSWGPPYGRDLNRAPGHEEPASEERHAVFEGEKARNYPDFERCNARLERMLEEEGGEHVGPVLISPTESLGHHTENGVTEELRCSGGRLTMRSWRVGGHAAAGHGAGHSGGAAHGEEAGHDSAAGHSEASAHGQEQAEDHGGNRAEPAGEPH